jgi:hypothetical protein
MNGLTTYKGSMQMHRDLLNENGVLFSEFREPDINDALTGIAFIVDERVFNKEDYPDYEEVIHESMLVQMQHRKEWVDRIGGGKNVFLREFLTNFRLA